MPSIYTPDATNTAQPSDADYAYLAAAELRTLKAYLATQLATLGGPVNTSLIRRKNHVVNGGMQVSQQGPNALSATDNTTYCADQISVVASGGTGLAGNGANTSDTNFRSGYKAGALSANWTSATMKVQTRLESNAVIGLNGKAITVACLVHHDIGSTRTCQIVIKKANALDDFSAVTVVGTSPGVSVPSGTATQLSYTLTLGTADASNGLLISIEDTAASSGTGKTFAVGDLQLIDSAVNIPFEITPYQEVLRRCLRYYFKAPLAANAAYFMGMCDSTTGVRGNLIFPEIMRATPTLITTGVATDYHIRQAGGTITACSSVPTIAVASAFAADLSFTVASGLTAGQAAQVRSNSASSFLAFSARL